MTLEKKVLLLDKEAKTPSQNLATNQYFVDLVRQKQYDLIARIYKHTNGVILGYNESSNDVDMEFCRENNYEVIRRPTGGSAVVVDPDTTLCYTIIFDPLRLGRGKNINALYKEITIPLAKKLGLGVTVEGAYYLRMRLNGSSIPFAGHAIKLHDGKIAQFDGVINMTPFDMEKISGTIRLRELYSFNGSRYIKSNGQVYDLQGNAVDIDLKQSKLLGKEIDELRKVKGLIDMGINDEKFSRLFREMLEETFGGVEEGCPKIDPLALFYLQEQIKKNGKGGTKSGLGHCFVDFVEPEPRIHYAKA